MANGPFLANEMKREVFSKTTTGTQDLSPLWHEWSNIYWELIICQHYSKHLHHYSIISFYMRHEKWIISLWLYPLTLLNSFIISNSSLVGFLGFSTFHFDCTWQPGFRISQHRTEKKMNPWWNLVSAESTNPEVYTSHYTSYFFTVILISFSW